MAAFFSLYGLMFISSLSATTIITLPVSKLAFKLGIVDHPGLHKTHNEIKPLLGGLAIFLGISLAMLIYSTASTEIITILIAMLIILITGLLDDIYNIKPLQKMFGQTAAAAVVVLLNPDYFYLFVNFFDRLNIPGNFALILIIAWIVLMINAFNLIDGMDGLAAGTAAILFTAMAVINFLNLGNTDMLGLQVIAAGACIGFLFYNFHPARIFMGDTGSMLLGFLLATTYLFSLGGIYGGNLVLGSLFIFGYPVLDVTFAIVRRLRRRTSIFKADKGHIHHILLSLGLSVRKTALIIFLLSIFFSSMAVVLLLVNVGSTILIAIGVMSSVITLAFFRYLTIVSRRNGLDVDIEPSRKYLQTKENLIAKKILEAHGDCNSTEFRSIIE